MGHIPILAHIWLALGSFFQYTLKKFTDTEEGNSETGFVTQLKLSEFSQETFTLENHDYG